MSSAAARASRKSFAAGAALFALTTIAYAPVLSNGFIWDDDAYVTRNPTLESAAGLWRIWLEPGATPQYYPLVFTSFWLERWRWGLDPAAYHAVNVVLHALNAVLLWLALRRLQVPAAWFIACLFALHPVQVESVAWITERKNVLSTTFYLAAALAYWRFALPTEDGDGAGGGWGWYVAALGLFACALLSKTVACSLPAALLLVAWWKRGRVTRRDLWPLAPMFALGAAAGVFTAWLEKHHVGASGPEWALAPVERCLVAGRALWFYAAKLAWPASLTFIYPRWQIDRYAWWQYLYPATAVLVVVVLYLLRHRIGRGPVTALCFFGGTLFPALGFINVYPMRYTFVADHFQYLACVGLLALAGATAYRGLAGRAIEGEESKGGGGSIGPSLALRVSVRAIEGEESKGGEGSIGPSLALRVSVRASEGEESKGGGGSLSPSLALRVSVPPALRAILGAMVLTALGALTWRQAHIYRDADSVWLDTIQKNRACWMAHYNLGVDAMTAGRLPEAVAHFTTALVHKPDNHEAHNNLASTLVRLGRRDEARRHYDEALAIKPDHGPTHFNLAQLLMDQGDLAGATAHLVELCRLYPESAEFQIHLTWLLIRQGRPVEAREHLDDALKLAPRDARKLQQLGMLLDSQGRRAEAAACLRQAEAAAVAEHQPELGRRIREQLRVLEKQSR
jgi:Flp pilus assembly protein TadD